MCVDYLYSGLDEGVYSLDLSRGVKSLIGSHQAAVSSLCHSPVTNSL